VTNAAILEKIIDYLRKTVNLRPITLKLNKTYHGKRPREMWDPPIMFPCPVDDLPHIFWFEN